MGNGAIYAVGGYSSDAGNEISTKSMEKYNPVEDKWIFVANMNNEQSCHTACVLQEKLFVVVSWDASNKSVKSIECYNPDTDKWNCLSFECCSLNVTAQKSTGSN